MIIAGGLAALVAIAAGWMGRSTSLAYRSGATRVRLEEAARHASERVAERLRAAGASTLAPAGVEAPFSATALTFQRSEGYDAVAGAAVWGAVERIALEPEPGEPVDGDDDDGDGLVDEGRLVWRRGLGTPAERAVVLASGVARALEGETAGNGVDDNGNGLLDEAGLALWFDGARLELALTLERADPEGRVVRRTVRRSFAFDNPGP